MASFLEKIPSVPKNARRALPMVRIQMAGVPGGVLINASDFDRDPSKYKAFGIDDEKDDGTDEGKAVTSGLAAVLQDKKQAK